MPWRGQRGRRVGLARGQQHPGRGHPASPVRSGLGATGAKRGFVARRVSAWVGGRVWIFPRRPRKCTGRSSHRVRAEKVLRQSVPSPDAESEPADRFQWCSGRFGANKLAAFRDKIRALRDLMVGLVDDEWLVRLPRLRPRLELVLETPEVKRKTKPLAERYNCAQLSCFQASGRFEKRMVCRSALCQSMGSSCKPAYKMVGRQESNLRPSHCERDALPTELRLTNT